MKYVWTRLGKETKVEIIDNVMKVYSRKDFDPEVDKFYQLGSEVKVKLTIESVPSKR
jgi:hypothetical protein